MIRIGVYGIPFPKGMAMTNRLKLYCKALGSKDVMIDIISIGDEFERDSYDNVTYNVVPNIKAIPHRISYHFFQPILALMYARNVINKSDVLFIGSEGYISLFVIKLLCLIRGCKLVMELNENPYSTGLIRFQTKWMNRLNRFVALNTSYRFVDGFICISENLDSLIKRYNKEAKTVVIPILCDKIDEKLFVQKKESIYIFHSGFISPKKDGIYVVLEAFALACKKTKKKIEYVFTVKTIEKKYVLKLEAIIRKNNITDKIKWLGFIPKEEVDRYRQGASLAIINKPINEQNIYNFPTKLGEYLSEGIPVIASRTGELRRFLTDDVNAFMVDPDDTEAIASKIIEIIDNPQKAQYIGENGRQLAREKFLYSNFADVFYNFFKSLVEQSKKK